MPAVPNLRAQAAECQVMGCGVATLGHYLALFTRFLAIATAGRERDVRQVPKCSPIFPILSSHDLNARADNLRRIPRPLRGCLE